MLPSQGLEQRLLVLLKNTRKEVLEEISTLKAVFVQEISKESPEMIVLRGHLYIDAEIIKLLTNALPKSDAIDLSSDLTFAQRLKLSVALDLLNPAEANAIHRLQSMHYKLISQDKKKLHRQEELDLYSYLDENLQKSLEKYMSEPFPSLLNHIVLRLWMKVITKRRLRERIIGSSKIAAEQKKALLNMVMLS